MELGNEPYNADASALLLSKGDEEVVVEDTYRELFVEVPPPNGDGDAIAPLPKGALLLLVL